jgi:hypothetical protein
LLHEDGIEGALSALADDPEEEGRPGGVDRALRAALATVACHAAVRAGRRLSEAEARALLDQMGGTPGAGTCPHGRPVAVRLALGDLARMFGAREQAAPRSSSAPTAVKTDSPDLAERLDGEIVGADSIQVFRGMDIGSAKPTPGERARVPHHLIDVADPDEPFSAGRYAGLAAEAIE